MATKDRKAQISSPWIWPTTFSKMFESATQQRACSTLSATCFRNTRIIEEGYTLDISKFSNWICQLGAALKSMNKPIAMVLLWILPDCYGSLITAPDTTVAVMKRLSFELVSSRAMEEETWIGMRTKTAIHKLETSTFVTQRHESSRTCISWKPRSHQHCKFS